ncbi:MAG: hypothetical protein FJ090_01150 [Deltaproteobacteria bacterium]|nr:hypothetical protein [Deltaproteobacteria bacterium]
MVDRLLLLAGPPFGPALFRGVEARLRTLAPSLRVESAAVPRGDGPPFAPEAAGALVFAHGLAIPAALRSGAGALILSNGPITRLDPATRSLAALGPLLAPLLHPAPWLRWLRSSAGLRRAVANPYAMDRDTVAALCGPAVADREGRRLVAAYLRWLPSAVPGPAAECPTWALWGDEDVLYPTSEADLFDAQASGGRVTWLPGGRFLHPEELPWAVADAVLARARELAVPGAGALPTAPMSRSDGSRPGSTKSTNSNSFGEHV